MSKISRRESLFCLGRFFGLKVGLAITFLTLSFQQLIVAYSTYTVATLGLKLGSGEAYIATMLTFFVLLVAVYVPGGLSRVTLQYAKSAAFQRWIVELSDQVMKKSDGVEPTEKNDVVAWVQGEALSTIDQGFEVGWGLVATTLNLVLNVIALSIVVDWSFLLSYTTSLFLAFTAYYIFRHHLAKVANLALKSSQRVRSILEIFWDNISLGNHHYSSKWISAFQKHQMYFIKRSITMEANTQVFSWVTMLLSSLPVVLGIYLIAIDSNMAKVTALAVTFPRQVQLLQMIHQFVGELARFNQYFVKLRHLIDRIRIKSNVPIEAHINLNLIKVRGVPFISIPSPDLISLDLLVKYFSSLSTGRVTITGPNGCGKSSLLKLLKGMFLTRGKTAFLSPANSVNLLVGNAGQADSTGQRTAKLLNDAIASEDQVLLLDEWDANLDHVAVGKFDTLLNLEASKRIVVEVRHR